MNLQNQIAVGVATGLTTLSNGWSAARIRVGRFIFEDVRVGSRQGAFDLNESLRLAADKTRRVRGAQSRYVEPLPMSAPARIISVETADYLKNLDRSGVELGTLRSKKFCFRLLKLACGDIPVSDITASHINDFWDVHRWWPLQVGNKTCFKGLTDQQILDAGKAAHTPARKAGSIKSAAADLGAFFNHLVRMRVLHHSPIDPNFEMKDDLIGPDARRAFTLQELAGLFAPQNLVPWASVFPHRWWGVQLGLYTGARVNEIAQLKVADVVQHHGHWAISIRKTVDADMSHNTRRRTRQRVKGRSSIRTIPLAQPLLDAGFLDYVADVRATRHPRLFPHLSCGVSRTTGELNGSGYGRALSLEFSRYLHGLFNLPTGFSFHLFRHTFGTELNSKSVNKLLIASITGHVPRAMAVALEDYIHEKADQLIEEQIEAIGKFNPQVELPIYVRGQFARQFGADAKFHP